MLFENTSPSCPFLGFLDVYHDLPFAFFTRIILAVPERLFRIDYTLGFMCDIRRIILDSDGYPIGLELNFYYRRDLDAFWNRGRVNK